MNSPGKTVGQHAYLHIDALGVGESSASARVESAATLAELEAGADFNVVKLDRSGLALSLLDYLDFFDVAFPVLRRARSVGHFSRNLKWVRPISGAKKGRRLLPSAARIRPASALVSVLRSATHSDKGSHV
jgi:hypothetical protein